MLTTVLGQLDAEETALSWASTRNAAVRESVLRSPDVVAGACQHLTDAVEAATPETPNECPPCVAEGLRWVHLRSCVACGAVGCCDSSVGSHASKHYEQEAHPVMQSIEAGEAWRWCFVDEVLG